MANEAHKEPTMEEILASIRKIISDDDTTSAPAEPVTEVAGEGTAEVSEEGVEQLTFDASEDELDDSVFEESALEDVFEMADAADVSETVEAEDASESVELPEEYAELEEVEVEAAETVESETYETAYSAEPEVESATADAAEDEDLSFEAMLGAVNKVAEDYEAVSGEIEAEVEAEVVETLTAEPENTVETLEPEMSAMPKTQGSRLTDETTAGAAAGSLGKLLSTIELGSENTLDGLVRELLKPMIKEWLDQNLASIVEQKVEAEVQRIASMAR